MANRKLSVRVSVALLIGGSSVQPGCATRTLITGAGSATSTAAKYSSKAALRRCLRCPNAALACSTPVCDDPARGSGRRGRRFKSCHPDRVSAGQRPLPELVRASLAARTAAKYRKYRNKSEHLSFSSRGFPQPALRFAGTKRPRLKSCHPEQSSGGSFLKESVGRSTRRPGWHRRHRLTRGLQGHRR